MNEVPKSLTWWVEEFLIWCRSEKGYSKNTVLSYKSDLKKLIDFFENDYKKISEKSIIKFLNLEFSTNLFSEKSQARLISCLKVFFNFLTNNANLSFNFDHILKSPKVNQSLPKAISYSDVEKILNAFTNLNDSASIRNSTILEVMYSCALRISECVGLNVEDVDLERKNIKVFGKGSKERIIPIGEIGINAIKKYLISSRPNFTKSSSEKALFLNNHGRRLTRQTIWDIVKKAQKLSGILSNVTPHTLRHSCATHMIESGANIRIVQEFLGHVSISTTQIYTSISNELLYTEYAKAHPRYKR